MEGGKISLEDILGARNKIRMLKLFIKREFITFSELRRAVRLNYNTLKEYIKTLVDAGIIKEYEISRFRIYELNKDDPKVQSLVYLFKVWGEIEGNNA
ncbi:MAG: winged helix-turn-helix domain-containing protein [Candidatus Njordarchaeales archaeon]